MLWSFRVTCARFSNITFIFFFFFSSRRRHTRCSRDWSSDVCSSDLGEPALNPLETAGERHALLLCVVHRRAIPRVFAPTGECEVLRSEERRVGEGWRSWWAADPLKKKNKEYDTTMYKYRCEVSG